VTVAIIAPIAGRWPTAIRRGILGGIGLGVLSLGFILLALLPASTERCRHHLANRRLRIRVRFLPVAE